MIRKSGAGPFDLDRFVDAQKSVYPAVVSELTAGQKRSHWMWYIFPQIAGLGFSEMSQRYAISGRDEAAAYLNHTVLGARLRECTQLVLNVRDRDINEILGSPDDLKFRSSMTLFQACASDGAIFQAALDRYFDGEPDSKTVELIEW